MHVTRDRIVPVAENGMTPERALRQRPVSADAVVTDADCDRAVGIVLAGGVRRRREQLDARVEREQLGADPGLRRGRGGGGKLEVAEGLSVSACDAVEQAEAPAEVERRVPERGVEVLAGQWRTAAAADLLESNTVVGGLRSSRGDRRLDVQPPARSAAAEDAHAAGIVLRRIEHDLELLRLVPGEEREAHRELLDDGVLDPRFVGGGQDQLEIDDSRDDREAVDRVLREQLHPCRVDGRSEHHLAERSLDAVRLEPAPAV
jgi:hypothetical protein